MYNLRFLFFLIIVIAVKINVCIAESIVVSDLRLTVDKITRLDHQLMSVSHKGQTRVVSEADLTNYVLLLLLTDRSEVNKLNVGHLSNFVDQVQVREHRAIGLVALALHNDFTDDQMSVVVSGIAKRSDAAEAFKTALTILESRVRPEELKAGPISRIVALSYTIPVNNS